MYYEATFQPQNVKLSNLEVEKLIGKKLFLLRSSFRLYCLLMMSHLLASQSVHVTETGFARQATINFWMEVGSRAGGA